MKLEVLKNVSHVLIVPVYISGLFVYAWLSKSDLPTEQKLWIVGALVVVLGGGAVLVVGITYRKVQNIALAMNFLFLLVVVGCTLAPAVLLWRNGQIILLKLGAVLFFSLLPGWLYLQFIVVKGKSLREEFILNLYRLHVDTYRHLPKPPAGSIFYERWEKSCKEHGGIPSEEQRHNNLYLRKFKGLYGESLLDSTDNKGDDAANADAQGSRFHGENFLPIMVTTMLLAVGWALVVQPEELLNLYPAEITLSGQPALPGEALRFGFVGSYFFVLQMLVRRYFQDDLKTGAYINALTRVILVVLLVTAVNSVWPANWSQPQLNAFAFLVGIFPQVGLRAIQALINLPLRKVLKSLDTDYPLSDLDGLNIWYESRLLEESIEDMQNLAKSNLVDVILRTRIPVERLVDWVDQAHLCLHVNKFDRKELRRLGVRTATDLESSIKKLAGASLLQPFRPAAAAETASGNAQTVLATEQKIRKKRFGRAKKEELVPSERLTIKDLEAILETLEKEPNLYHVRQWKKFTKTLEKSDQSEDETAGAQPSPPASNGQKPRDDKAGHDEKAVVMQGS